VKQGSSPLDTRMPGGARQDERLFDLYLRDPPDTAPAAERACPLRLSRGRGGRVRPRGCASRPAADQGRMTAAQCRQARALLGWSEQTLAVRALCSSLTVRNLERRNCRPRMSTISAIRDALEGAGVEFAPEGAGGAGVRLRKSGFGTHAPSSIQSLRRNSHVCNKLSKKEPACPTNRRTSVCKSK
jgi:transcriptional regulator with XRE-family HTH domain